MNQFGLYNPAQYCLSNFIIISIIFLKDMEKLENDVCGVLEGFWLTSYMSYDNTRDGLY